MTAIRQIAGWLKELGMSEYSDRFAEDDIDFDVLEELTDQDFDRLGVSIGHRRRMLSAIQNHGGDATEVPQFVTASPASVESAERRQLTVMFCDLEGSAALSGRLDPEDLRGIIGAYHRCCTELIERNGGFVVKYMGDGVLAYFGYPQAYEHDAERAVRAGLALTGAVPKLAKNRNSPLQVRVGVATGLVVVSDLIGAGAAQERAVSETLNLVAPLHSLAEPGALVVSSSTRRLTGGLFEYRDLNSVWIGGFGKNLLAFQVVGASSTESRFEALRSAATPLVGRDEEIDLFMRRWEQAKHGDGCVVLISGEPGIGKSRIVQAVLDGLSGESHTRLRSFCSPHHQDSALYPTITRLERAAGFLREDSDEQRLNKLEAILGEATDDLGDVVPLLAALLSIPTRGRYPPLNLSPQKQKEKTLHALLARVEGLAAKQPVLIVWEDVHWSDPTSRELLDLTVDRLPSLSALLIVTFRPEFRPPWAGRSHVTLLSLNRLRPPQRAEMITHVTSGKILPKEIVDQIIDRTDGIPLFIEELTKAVVESGILAETCDGYRVVEPVAPLLIPATLHASLLARFDRPAPTREVAQIAAALGRKFSHELISTVATIPQQRLDDALAQLVTAELIFRRGTPPNAEYTFKHALVQDVAYSTLLPGQRRQIHARVVATLKSQFSEVVATQPQIVAWHCAEAGFNEKAIGYWLKAGQQAVARSAMSEAVAQLQKGLSLLAALPDDRSRQQQELDLRIALAQAQMATRGLAAVEARDNYARARVLAEHLDRPDYLSLLHGQFIFHLIRAEHKLAQSCAHQMEKIGEARNNPTMVLLGRSRQAVSHYFLGEFVAAQTLFEQCNDLIDPKHRVVSPTSEDERVIMLGQLAQNVACLGYLDSGRAQAKRALSEARLLQHAHTLAFALHFACVVEWFAGSPNDLQRHANELVALSSEHGFPFWLARGIVHQGGSVAAHDQAHEGIALLRTGLSTYRATGAVATMPLALMLLMQACFKLGWLVECQDCLTEAGQLIEATEERYAEAELHRLRGDLLNATGDQVAAKQSYLQALAVAERQSAKVFKLRAATSFARLRCNQGKCTEARDLLAPIYSSFTEGFDTPVLQDARALIDRLA
jgi:class 3 adenylate cyclase/tetratricopeptide (TPR) repeat protein